MTCHEARDATQAALDGRLGEADRPALEAHLAGCAACRAERSALDRVAAAFAAAPVEVGPLDLVDRLGLAPAAPVPLAPRRPARRLMPALGGLVAAAVIAGVGLALVPGAPPAVVASVEPAAIAVADEGEEADVILTWFGPEADYQDPLAP
jgi:predicted anti-sigma-YlaC factor YlaD